MNDESPPLSSARIGEHIVALRRFALSLTRNTDRADDLVQDTMLRAVLHFDSFRPGTNLRAWLFTIERNIHYSNRHRALREMAVMRQLGATSAVALPAHDGVLAMEEFLDAFRQLSASHRRVLLLVGALGYTHRETSETICMSPRGGARPHHPRTGDPAQAAGPCRKRDPDAASRFPCSCGAP